MPKKPPIPCRHRGCPNLVESGYCPEHKKLHDSRYHKSRTDSKEKKIYDSARWKSVRKTALYRDGGMCVVCGNPAVVVDHIIEIKDGGAAFALENLQSLCFRCHAIKTKEAEKARRPSSETIPDSTL